MQLDGLILFYPIYKIYGVGPNNNKPINQTLQFHCVSRPLKSGLGFIFKLMNPWLVKQKMNRSKCFCFYCFALFFCVTSSNRRSFLSKFVHLFFPVEWLKTIATSSSAAGCNEPHKNDWLVTQPHIAHPINDNSNKNLRTYLFFFWWWIQCSFRRFQWSLAFPAGDNHTKPQIK